MDFEPRPHVPPLGDSSFLDQHNVKLFALMPAHRVSYYVPVLSWCGSYDVLRILSDLSPSFPEYYSDYILHGSLLRSSIASPITLSEHIVFSVISFLVTVQDRLTAMPERYSCVPDGVESGLWARWPLWLVGAIKELGFFHIVWSTDFDASLAYVAFRLVFEIGWRPVPILCHSPFYRIIGAGQSSETAFP